MDRTDIKHWTRLWTGLNLKGDSQHWHSRLLAAYTEPRRNYHNLQHLTECLTMFDHLEQHATFPRLAELALWFHDAVYEPRAADNEERSADLAHSCLAEAGVNPENLDHVCRLILATKRHHPDFADAQVVCDADLAILGQPQDRYWEYENSIAMEYSWVAQDVYRVKRCEVLDQFLAREALYHTTSAYCQFEQQARENLAAAITRLRTSAS